MRNSLLIKKMKLYLMLLGIFSSMIVSAQTRITGKVIGSDDKQPIIGATVRIKGSTVGTVTDVSGNFSISAKSSDVITVSYLGYQPQDITVGGQTNLRVSLTTTNSTLNEVVVTGYTTQRKKDIAGAVATVDISSAKQLPTASSDQLLQGQATGVTVISQGAPGQGSQVFVRGISNFGNSQPLYVIDGVQTSSMNDVNPNDIESISVLKDAGAAAIYGVAGGNGVVVVTTKKGTQGKSVISYDGYYGVQKPLSGNPYNVLDGAGYIKLLQTVDPGNALLINGQLADYGYQGGANTSGAKGVANAGNPAVSPSLYVFDPGNSKNNYQIQQFNKQGVDWFHTVFKNAPTQSHNVSASGANDKNAYFLSLGYLDQQGTLLNTYYKRYQTRINTTFNIRDHIRVGETASLYYVLQPGNVGNNNNEGNTLSEVYRIEPIIPVYDIAGNYGGTFAGPAQLGNATNPLAIQQYTQYNQNKSWNISGTLFAEADLFKHVTARTSISGETNNIYYRNLAYTPYFYGEQYANPNGITENAQYYSKYNWTNTLRYTQVFGKHNVSLLAGYEQKDNNSRYLNGTGNGLFSIDNSYATLTGTTTGQVITSGVYFQPSSTQSIFSRLDYIYNDKYILGATIRRDAFSAFAPGRRVGYFPSVSLAWRVSQEDFLKDVSWLNNLKLRGSYGAAGFNGNVPGANSYSTFGSSPSRSYYPIAGTINSSQQGFFNNQLGNTKTTWETDKIANIGVDATVFKDFDFSAEYFVKNSTNLLFSVTLPATVGGSAVAGSGAPTINVGSVKNRGFELTANYHGGSGSAFTYNVGLNVTTFKNQITSLFSQYFDAAGSRIGNIVREQIGQPIGEFYGYKVIGYFSSAADVASSPTQTDAAAGRFKYQDTNGDGKITDADRTFLGNPNPSFTYGLNLSAAYKGFDFTAVFYGSQGNKIFNYTKYWTNFYSSLAGNKSNDLLNNAWSPTNLNPKTPKAEAISTFSTDAQVNSYYVENGSFLKARVIQLGYTFGQNQMRYIGVNKLNVYIQATNLFTATKYSGLDPEITASAFNGNANNSGIDYGNYPNNEKKFLVGLRFTF